MKKKQIGWVACLLSLFYICLVKWNIGFLYSVNDDRFARDILSGAYSGTPDGHLEHIRFILCWPLTLLYRIAGNVDWYGLMLLGLEMLCLTLVLYRIGCRTKNWKRLLLYWLLILELFSICWLNQVVFFTYTTVAGIVAATAVFWYMTGEDKWSDWVIAAMLAWVTYALRDDSFFMAVPVAGAAFLYKQVIKTDKWDWKTLQFPALIAIGLAVIAVINVVAYRGEVWKNYREYDRYRIDIYDYYKFPDYNEFQAEYEELGLTRSDYHTLVRYGVSLDKKYDVELFKKLQVFAKRVHGEEMSTLRRIKDGVKEAWGQFRSDEFRPFSDIATLLWIAAIGYVLWKKKWRYAGMGAVLLASQGILWFYAGFRRRFPDRIAMSLFIMLILTATAFWWNMPREETEKSKKKGYLPVLGAVIAIAILFPSMAGGIAHINKNSIRNTNYNLDYNNLCDYCNEHSENFYFVDVDSISRFTGIFEVTRENPYMNYVALGDWMCFMSPYFDKLEKEGITDVRDAILNQDNVYVIAKDAFNLDYLTTGFPENVEYEIVDVIPCNLYEFYVYRYYTRPETEAYLSQAHMRRFKTNVNADLAKNVKNGDVLTRWNAKQKPGVSFEVQLDDIYPVSGVRMTLGEWSTDYPRDMTLETSTDGVHWTVQELSGDQKINFRFEETECKWIRMTLGENAGVKELDLDWSIENLEVYTK